MYDRPTPPSRPMPKGAAQGAHQPPVRHHHRKKRRTARLGIVGAVTGAVGIAVIAAAIVILRPEPILGGDTGSGSSGADAIRSVQRPQTGPTLSVVTPEGFGYGLAAVKAGTSPAPLGEGKPPGEGLTYAFADYVITNTQRRPVLLDYPADLFAPIEQVPDNQRSRCMPQPGVPDDMCTLPNRSVLTARVGDSEPPTTDGADKVIPPGASYVVRIATDLPLKSTLKPEELRLYLWDARYTTDRRGIEIEFP